MDTPTQRPPNFSPWFRARKAYSTALTVMLRYGRMWFLKRFLGQKWYDKRITALHLRNAELVKNTIMELQGLFIKMGQLLSILSNFLPEDFQRPLEALQDKLPARPIEEVRKRILDELGNTPEILFKKFENEPLATASIGQAHRATLHDGTDVVVKIQHYGIEAVAAVDLRIVKRITKITTWFMDIQGMDHLYSEIRKMIEEELDFSREAVSMEQIRQNLSGEKNIAIPVVHADFCTSKILTTTFHEGVKISNLAALEQNGIDTGELAARLIRIWCLMMLRDGYYHADPHPGNLLVERDGTLVLLDFGATAIVPPQFREGLSDLVEASIKNDVESMIEACRKMEFLSDGPDAEKIARKIIRALRNFLQNEVQITGLNFKDIEINPFNNSLADLIRDIGFKGIAGTMQIPKEYVLLNRTLTLLLGISNTIAPAFNPLEVIRPQMKEFVLAREGGTIGYIRNFIQRSATTLIALPDDIQKTLRKARSGELDIRTPDQIEGARMIAGAIRRLSFALIAVAAAFLGHSFWQNNDPATAKWIWGAGSLFLLFSVLKRKY